MSFENRSYTEGGIKDIFGSKKKRKTDDDELGNFFSKESPTFLPVTSSSAISSKKRRSKNNSEVTSDQNETVNLKKPKIEKSLLTVSQQGFPDSKRKINLEENVQVKTKNAKSTKTEKLQRETINVPKATKQKSLIEDSNKSSKSNLDKFEASKDTQKELRTLFIGNLSVNVNKKTLKKLFANYGKVESLRLRSAVPAKYDLPKRVAVFTGNFHPEKQNINAYIVMDKISSAEKAMKLNGQLFEGKRVRVDFANKSNFDLKKSIFVGNLPFNVSEDEVWTFFEDCGNVEGVRLIRDARTGVGKGFGYVLFDSADAMNIALQRNEQMLNNRALRVTRAREIKKKKEKARTTSRNNAEIRIARKLNANGPVSSSFQGIKSKEEKKERFKVEKGLKSFKKKSQTNKKKNN